MIKNCKVSVIMSTYNSRKIIERSVNSILNQSFKNLEILIIDDGSKDETWNTIYEYSNEYKNVKVFRNKQNIGLTKSLNILAKQATGDFIARQDDDDFSYPNRIQEQLDCIEKYNLDFCTSRATRNNSSKLIPGISFYIPKKLVLRYKNPFIHGSLLIKEPVLRNVGYYDERFYFAQDYKLMKTLINNGYKFKIVNEALYDLNMINNISSNFYEKQRYYANCVRKNLIPEENNENLY